MKVFDVVVVGSGLAGGWAALKLSQAGLRVLVLEAGRQLDPRVDLPGAQVPTNAGPGTTPHQAAYPRHKIQSQHMAFSSENQHLFVDDVDHPYATPDGMPFVWIRSRHVGGRSLLWGAVTPRFAPFDFKPQSQDGFGEDWPLSYEEMAPFYDEVERFLGVTGTVEGVDALPDGCFAPPPPLTQAETNLKTALEKRWPERRLMIARGIPHSWDPGHAEERTPWPRVSSNATTLDAALRTGNVEIRPDAVVARLTVDPRSGRVDGIACRDRTTFREEVVPAKFVVLAASTIESTRILLNSACREHPEGLGNSSGALGRYLMDHPTIAIVGLVPGAEGKGDFLGGGASCCIPRFRNLGSRKEKFMRGYGIWGAVHRHLDFLDALGGGFDARKNPGRFMLQANCEMLPQANNRVTIDKNLRDTYGIPVPHIECKYSDNDLAVIADAQEVLREIVACGELVPLVEFGLRPPGWFIHEVGTTRMGSNPKTSVLNKFNQVWDVPNLFVVDGGAFTSGAAQNPSLTIMAMSARASHHLAEHVKRGEGGLLTG